MAASSCLSIKIFALYFIATLVISSSLPHVAASGDHEHQQRHLLGWIPSRSCCWGTIIDCLAGDKEFGLDLEEFCTHMLRMFYGPGGPYALFAGRDASRALALMSFDPQDLTGNIEGLDASDLEVLQDWEYKFVEKYRKVGQLVSGRKQAELAENGDKMQETESKEENEAKQTTTSE